MRRYIFTGDPGSIRNLSYDVVIVGCGVAALYAALSLDRNLSCALITRKGAR